MNEQQVKVGDTILISDNVHLSTHDLNSKYKGRRFVVTKVGEDRVDVLNEDIDGPHFFFNDEYNVISEQAIPDQKCPECKGAGKVLLFHFYSPCSLCSSTK